MYTNRVYLIDDSRLEARWIAQFFRSEETHQFNLVGSAITLKEGLDKLEFEEVDVLLLDLTLPDSEGIDTLQRTVERYPRLPVVILTGTNSEELGMKLIQSGAQDYLVKDQITRVAFFRTLRYAIERKRGLLERDKLVSDLRKALSEIKRLNGLLPICAWCKKIRDDSGYWQQIEEYLHEHSEAQFTHGLCPDCHAKVIDDLKQMNNPEA